MEYKRDEEIKKLEKEKKEKKRQFDPKESEKQRVHD